MGMEMWIGDGDGNGDDVGNANELRNGNRE
jgi:hypothetical protein